MYKTTIFLFMWFCFFYSALHAQQATKLKKYYLQFNKKYHDLSMDQIKYDLKIYYDSNPVSRIQTHPGSGFMVHCEFYAPPELLRI